MKKRFALVSLVLLLIITACSNKISTIREDAKKFKQDYEALNGIETSKSGVFYRTISIEENNPIIYSSFKEVADKIDNKESFVVYVGFSSCPWCRSVIPYVLESAKENDIKDIYYVNVRSDNTRESDLRGYYKLNEKNKPVVDIKADENYYRVLNTLNDYLKPYTLETSKGKKVLTGENRLYAPSFIVYIDGVAVGLDECIPESLSNGYEELTENIIKEIKDMANNLFQKYNK